jgi:hypothetical protein
MSGRDLVSEMRESGKVPPVPRSGSTLDLLLVVVVMVAVGSAGYFGLTSWLSSGAPQPIASPPPASTAQGGTITAVAWTEADSARCKAKARDAVDAPLPGEMAIANRAVTEGFSGLATSLDCYLSTKVARFCAPPAKAAMVAAVNDYLGRVDLVELGLGLEGAPMALLGGMMGGEIAGGSAVYDEERDETLKFMASYHKRIAADLQALARDGIVAPSDFGGLMGGVPKTVLTMFGNATAQRNVCT